MGALEHRREAVHAGIADALGKRNAELGKRRTLLCVDAVHGSGSSPSRSGSSGATSSSPAATSGSSARAEPDRLGPRRAWEEVSPTIPSFTDPESFGAWLHGSETAAPTTAVAFTPGGYQAFEHRWALTAAFAFRQEIGRERAAERPRRSRGAAQGRPRRDLRRGRADAAGRRLSAGLVCCDVPAANDPEAFVQQLYEHGVVASLTPYATRYLRFGPSIANSEEEVDRAVEGVRS